jgi:hypothetical protein
MARAAISVTALAGGGFAGSAVGSVPDIASVVADTAVLVADGASPTQAHVTTLNGHVTPLNAAISGDLTVTWDGTKITTQSQLNAAVNAVLSAARAGYGGALT